VGLAATRVRRAIIIRPIVFLVVAGTSLSLSRRSIRPIIGCEGGIARS
jgi:hypothetical protein